MATYKTRKSVVDTTRLIRVRRCKKLVASLDAEHEALLPRLERAVEDEPARLLASCDDVRKLCRVGIPLFGARHGRGIKVYRFWRKCFLNDGTPLIKKSSEKSWAIFVFQSCVPRPIRFVHPVLAAVFFFRFFFFLQIGFQQRS